MYASVNSHLELRVNNGNDDDDDDVGKNKES